MSTSAVATMVATPIRSVRRSRPVCARGRKTIAVPTSMNAIAITLFGTSAEAGAAARHRKTRLPPRTPPRTRPPSRAPPPRGEHRAREEEARDRDHVGDRGRDVDPETGGALKKSGNVSVRARSRSPYKRRRGRTRAERTRRAARCGDGPRRRPGLTAISSGPNAQPQRVRPQHARHVRARHHGAGAPKAAARLSSRIADQVRGSAFPAIVSIAWLRGGGREWYRGRRGHRSHAHEVREPRFRWTEALAPSFRGGTVRAATAPPS